MLESAKLLMRNSIDSGADQRHNQTVGSFGGKWPMSIQTPESK